MSVAGGRSRLGITGRNSAKNPNRVFVKRWQKSSMPKWKEKTRFILQKDHEWRNEFLYTSRPEVEPQNRDLNVKNFRSSPNPVVASVFGRLRECSKSTSTP